LGDGNTTVISSTTAGHFAECLLLATKRSQPDDALGPLIPQQRTYVLPASALNGGANLCEMSPRAFRFYPKHKLLTDFPN
jgi:hypothetical protein